MVVSLYKWCGQVLVDAATRAFYGDALVETEPTIINDYLDFDEHCWMLLYQYPSFLARKMSAPRERVLRSFSRYLSIPPEERRDAAYYTQSLEAELIQAEMNTKDRAAAFQLFHFATNANAYKLAFWLLAHTLADPSLLSTLRTEIAPAIAPTTADIDINILVSEQQCPTLNAAFEETLRYTSSATSARTVFSPTEIGGKILYPGARVLLPYRLSHMSDEAFGANVGAFDHRRFLDTKELSKHPAYRPFGGGTQYCSGRFLARREVLGFVACVLHGFDICLKDDVSFPRLDGNKPNLGVISPLPGDDVVVEIRPRKKGVNIA